MNDKIFDGPHKELHRLVCECRAALFSPEHAMAFRHPGGGPGGRWPPDGLEERYNEFNARMRGDGNVYALMTREHGGRNAWTPVYVGATGDLRASIRRRLLDGGHGTDSVHGHVREAVACGREIGVSYITVRPAALRSFIQEAIAELDEPVWNEHRPEVAKSWLLGKAIRASECASDAQPETMSTREIIAAMLRARAQRPPVSAKEIREDIESGRR